jgi:hypothetical protein
MSAVIVIKVDAGVLDERPERTQDKPAAEDCQQDGGG